MNKILKEIHYISLGMNVYEISIKNYNQIETKNFSFKRLYKNIITKNKYSLSQKFRKAKINKNIDYLNENKSPWYFKGQTQVDYSFKELFSIAAIKTSIFLNELNNEIFYKKKTTKQLTYAIKHIL